MDTSGHVFPNFLIGGAAQSGTSFLAMSVAQHPQVFMPARSVPEPHYFLKTAEYDKGLGAYAESWFSGARGEIAVGEKSSSYLFGGETVARRIINDLGSVRLIFALRNPIERTWAHYRFSALNGLETLDFEDALRQEDSRNEALTGKWAEIQPFNYTGRSRYAEQLMPFRELFGPENILVIKSETLQRDPNETFARLFKFLGVDPSFQPASVSAHRSPTVRNLVDQARCREVFGDRFGEVLKAVRMGADLDRHAATAEEREALDVLVNNLSHDPPQMSKAARQHLGDLFLPDLEALRRLVPFSIDDWHVDASESAKLTPRREFESRKAST